MSRRKCSCCTEALERLEINLNSLVSDTFTYQGAKELISQVHFFSEALECLNCRKIDVLHLAVLLRQLSLDSQSRGKDDEEVVVDAPVFIRGDVAVICMSDTTAMIQANIDKIVNEWRADKSTKLKGKNAWLFVSPYLKPTTGRWKDFSLENIEEVTSIPNDFQQAPDLTNTIIIVEGCVRFTRIRGIFDRKSPDVMGTSKSNSIPAFKKSINLRNKENFTNDVESESRIKHTHSTIFNKIKSRSVDTLHDILSKKGFCSRTKGIVLELNKRSESTKLMYGDGRPVIQSNLITTNKNSIFKDNSSPSKITSTNIFTLKLPHLQNFSPSNDFPLDFQKTRTIATYTIISHAKSYLTKFHYKYIYLVSIFSQYYIKINNDNLTFIS